MTETLANGYSSESAQQGLSNEYQYDRVQMVFKYLCVLVLWTKVASAFEGLTSLSPLQIYCAAPLLRFVTQSWTTCGKGNEKNLLLCVRIRQPFIPARLQLTENNLILNLCDIFFLPTLYQKSTCNSPSNMFVNFYFYPLCC